MDLHQAVLHADFRKVRQLIESGAAVNGRDEEKRSPLILCCLHDGESWALGVARMLLVYGALVGLCDSHGRTALVYAVLYERLGLTKLFLQALDFDLNHIDKYGHTAIWYAAQNSNRSIYDLVLKTVKRYSMKMPSNHNDHGHDWNQRPANQKVIYCSSINEVKGYPCAPSKSLPPLFRKNLPYQPLPANLWAKRENLYKRLKTPNTKCKETKKDLNGDPRNITWEKEQGGEKAISTPAKDWKLDMRRLMAALQSQISPSYRSPAQPQPFNSQSLRKTCCLGPSPTLDIMLRLRRHRGRRMSLDAVSDSLQKEKKPTGAFRRRCSVAVMPLVRLGVSSQKDSATRVEAKSGGGKRKGRVGEESVTPRPLKIQ